MSFTYPYPRPNVTVDLVVLGVPMPAPARVLLIQRAAEPFAGAFALPGGFLDPDEDLEAAARRELAEETGLGVGRLLQVGAFGAVDRDPRGRTVTVAFAAVHVGELPAPRAGDDARTARWCPLRRPPRLAFDHALVLRTALDALALHARCGDGLAAMLGRDFTLAELRALHAAVLGEEPEPRAFARRTRAMPGIVATGARRGREIVYRSRKTR
ncbi:MAG: NUDIX hydrolase [Planctomycetes bacterium]|nr:NUDIX hydrolase [Planctomycetota bacterium]